MELEDVFHAHYRRLVRMLTVAAGGDGEAAAEAVQDAFAQAHIHWRKVRRYDDPVAWLRRVAINRLSNERRRLGRLHGWLRRAETEASGIERERVAERVAEADAMTRAIVRLPARQRTAVALFYLGDRSVAAVAEAMGLSEGAVKYHLSEARRRLAEILEGQHESR